MKHGQWPNKCGSLSSIVDIFTILPIKTMRVKPLSMQGASWIFGENVPGIVHMLRWLADPLTQYRGRANDLVCTLDAYPEIDEKTNSEERTQPAIFPCRSPSPLRCGIASKPILPQSSHVSGSLACGEGCAPLRLQDVRQQDTRATLTMNGRCVIG
jgi:hypothetical protein